MNPCALLLLLAQDTVTPTASVTRLGTLYQTILDGGWMMVPIGACSILALAFFVERFFALQRGRLVPRDFTEAFEKNLAGGPDETRDFLAGLKAPVARIFEAGVDRWHLPRPQIEKAVEDAGTREASRLSGNLRPLVVVTAVAPLLGLLGTVIGMIKAFQTIALEKGIGKPELLAEGISQALVTTAAGLIVAIPAQVAYFYLRARVDRFTRTVESLYVNVMDKFLTQREAGTQ